MRIALVSIGLDSFIKDLAVSLGKDLKVDVFVRGCKEEKPFFEKGIKINESEIKVSVFKKHFPEFDLYSIWFIPHKTYWEDSLIFCHSVFILLESLGNYDIVFAKNWETALLMSLIKDRKLKAKAVFFINNMAHGLVPLEKKDMLGISGKLLDEIEFYGEISLLKAGILHSDLIITPSPSYAKEIQSPECGSGLDEVLRENSHKIYGILSGVNYKGWDPKRDAYIKATYSEEDLAGKKVCKEDLIREMNLISTAEMPVVGMITRFSEQKGLTLIIDAIEEIIKMGISLVILGEREEPILENIFLDIKNAFPGILAVQIGYEEKIAHKIIAGSDMFLDPSFYEPETHFHLYAMRYGSVPIVRATGFLNDTVSDLEDGFKFYEKSSSDMLKAIRKAVEFYEDKRLWDSIVKKGMKKAILWKDSARKYISLFREIIKKA